MSESIVLKRCAACGADKPVSEMKVCMHQQMHNYVCDSKCMHDFYNPPPAENQHARDSAELRDLCSQRDGFKAELWRVKEERDSQQRIAIAAMTELAELKAVMAESLDNYRAMLHDSESQVEELKAKMEGMVLVPDGWNVERGCSPSGYVLHSPGGSMIRVCDSGMGGIETAFAMFLKALLAAAPSAGSQEQGE